MGIYGLTRYIEERADYYLEPFELHDTKLIIDGWNLCCQLYSASAYNHAFGGSYGQYAEYVFQFFNDLLQCKVLPLVILDGGWEAKKKPTLIERMRGRIETAGRYSTTYQNCRSLLKSEENRLNNNFSGRQVAFPIFCSEVFIDVMKKLEIRYAMTTFEADDSIASIGKILNAPVLSYDSDFFIYGVDYIPFRTLETYPVRYAKGYVKKCRIYRTNTLLERFKGLDITVLPLASVLLGNDYINKETFRDFFNHSNGQSHSPIYNGRQQQIERIFNWLKNYTLKSAVMAVLDRFPITEREEVLKSIQVIVNGYLSLSTHMVQPLGIDEKFIMGRQKNFTSFKLQGDVQNFNIVGVENYIDEAQETHENEFSRLVPKWFIEELVAAKLPNYFIGIVTHQVYMMPVQVEDFTQPSAEQSSLPIITMICSILTTTKSTKANNANKVVQLLIRKDYDLGTIDLSVPPSFFAFEDIRMSEFAQRKRIMNDTLKIRANDKLNQLPFTWQLYFAVILFWMRHNDGIEHSMLHLIALLMTSLSGIIDRIIGFNRLKKTFRRKFFDEFTRIQQKKRFEKVVGNDESTVIVNMINSVSLEDAKAALPFFEDHASMNGKSVPNNFSISIVHVYAQFQSSLRHAMHLNALLGYIYTSPSPDEFLDGMLFHNLYRDFSTQPDVDSYIATKLERSPGLLRLFNALKQNILNALEIVVPDSRDRDEMVTERIRNELGRIRVSSYANSA